MPNIRKTDLDKAMEDGALVWLKEKKGDLTIRPQDEMYGRWLMDQVRQSMVYLDCITVHPLKDVSRDVLSSIMMFHTVQSTSRLSQR